MLGIQGIVQAKALIIFAVRSLNLNESFLRLFGAKTIKLFSLNDST